MVVVKLVFYGDIMKILFCPECCDIFNLTKEIRNCTCLKSWGYYFEDGLHAEISETAIPIGFNNQLFCNALNNRPTQGMGKLFEAFIIPKQCSTIKVL